MNKHYGWTFTRDKGLWVATKGHKSIRHHNIIILKNKVRIEELGLDT